MPSPRPKVQVLRLGVSKRGEAPLYKLFPLPLIKGKGIKGIGLKYVITD